MFQKILLILLISQITSQAYAKSSDQQLAWEDWKKQTFENALTSPTSFLNAYFLIEATQGQKIWLAEDAVKSKSKWLKTEPKTFDIVAEHLGDTIKVRGKGQVIATLSIKKDKRRYQIPLKNGAIAEVVYGRRSRKMWGYLYDPKQIEKFSGFRFFPYNKNAIYQGYFKSTPIKAVSHRTFQGDDATVYQIGNVSFQVGGKPFNLPAYIWEKKEGRPQKVEVIFVDQSAGKDTYGGGRGLIIDLPTEGQDPVAVTLDFNKTTNFYCAHSPYWHCPVGLQTSIAVNLKAGEMLPLRKVERK